MGWDDPDPANRNAIRQINNARGRAMKAVSEMRQADISTPHQNLAPAGDGGSGSLPVVCSQAVVDYLIQLHPYRHQSQNWGLDFGTIELPEEIHRGRSKRLGQKGRLPSLWCCEQPQVDVSNASELIQAVNKTVFYSTNKPLETAQKPDWEDANYTLRTEDHGELKFHSQKQFEAVAFGSITPTEAVEMGMPANFKDGEPIRKERSEPDYRPAKPFGRSSDVVEAYKVVFSADRLLRIVEHADEIAAEMDLLVDIDPPDYSATGRGAV